MGISDGNYDFYLYCAIQATALLTIYLLRKKELFTFGSPRMHYILGVIIGHVVYVFKDWILSIIRLFIYSSVELLYGDIDLFHLYCVIQASALLITYFLHKKRILPSGSPLLGLLIGHLVYVFRDMILSIIGISYVPFIQILNRDFDILYIYCPTQLIVLLITYFLRKKRILTSGFPLRHYILAFIIGNIVYSVGFAWLFFWSLSKYGFW